MHGVYDGARFVQCLPVMHRHDVAFSSAERDQHLEIRPLSPLNTQPMVSPVNASRLPSRVAAKDKKGNVTVVKPEFEDIKKIASNSGLSALKVKKILDGEYADFY